LYVCIKHKHFIKTIEKMNTADNNNDYDFLDSIDSQKKADMDAFLEQSKLKTILATVLKIINLPVSVALGYWLWNLYLEWNGRAKYWWLVVLVGLFIVLISKLTTLVYKSLVKNVVDYYGEIKSFDSKGRVCDNGSFRSFLKYEVNELKSETEDSFDCDINGVHVSFNEFEISTSEGKDSVYEGQGVMADISHEGSHTILIVGGGIMANTDGLYKVRNTDCLPHEFYNRFKVYVSDARALAEWRIQDKCAEIADLASTLNGRGVSTFMLKIEPDATTLICPGSTETFDSTAIDFNFKKLAARDFCHVSDLLVISRQLAALDFTVIASASDDASLASQIAEDDANQQSKAPKPNPSAEFVNNFSNNFSMKGVNKLNK